MNDLGTFFRGKGLAIFDIHVLAERRTIRVRNLETRGEQGLF